MDDSFSNNYLHKLKFDLNDTVHRFVEELEKKIKVIILRLMKMKI